VNPTGFYLAEVCRLYVLLLLAAAAIGKAREREAFSAAVGALLYLGRGSSRAVANAVIAAEIAIALLLAGGESWAYWGSVAAIMMFGLFTMVLARAIAQGRAIACNCFGSSGHVISAYDLGRNAVLIAACGFYLFQAPTAREVDLAIWSVLTGIALIAVTISINLDEIAALVR
jgi:hypothetical protein